MNSYRLLSLFALSVLPLVHGQNLGTCFQTCANNSSSDFNCTGLDIACYCNLDNGAFLPKLIQCVKQNCGNEAAAILQSLNNCPGSTTTVTTQTTAVNTLTVTGKATATQTSTGTVTNTDTLTVIGSGGTSTITTTNTRETTVTNESGTDLTLTLTTTSTGNTTITTSGGSGNDTSTMVTTVPTSTQYTTITTDGSTFTSAISTLFRTSTRSESSSKPSQTGAASSIKVGSCYSYGIAAFLASLVLAIV